MRIRRRTVLVVTQHSTFLGSTGMQTEHKRAESFDVSNGSPLVLTSMEIDPKEEENGLFTRQKLSEILCRVFLTNCLTLAGQAEKKSN